MEPITKEEFLSRLKRTKERLKLREMEMRAYYQEMCKAEAATTIG